MKRNWVLKQKIEKKTKKRKKKEAWISSPKNKEFFF